MVKEDIVKQVIQRTGIQKTDVEEIINAFLITIKENVNNGHRIHMRQFGNFTLKAKAAKLVRDISRGRAYILPARHVPHFKPSKHFSILNTQD
jgi:DNA-binding protein HU-beta